MRMRLQSSTDHSIAFLMVDSADHVSGKTGLSPSVALSKDGGAFGSALGAVTELSNGWYKLAANATDRDTLGELAIHISAAEAAQVESGTLAISTDHTFEGVITSSSTEAINTAKLILAIKDSRYEDSESMILIDSENGLTVVDGAEYATGTNGSISASGSSGDWSIGLKISKVVASLLSAYVGRTLDAELKAILADGDAISVWTGECKIARGVVRAVS